MLSSIASTASGLLPHQAAAIQAALTHLTENNGDRGQLLMACGTGKTRTAIRLAEKLAADHVLVLVPNLSLLAQTLREWREHSRNPFRAVAVCSDRASPTRTRTPSPRSPSPSRPTPRRSRST